MDPIAQFLSQYGVLAVLGYIVVKDVGGLVLKKLTTSSVPAVLPANPTAPSQHPILDALLGKAYGAKVTGQTAAPSLLSSLLTDVTTALANQGQAPTPPAPAAPPAAAPK